MFVTFTVFNKSGKKSTCVSKELRKGLKETENYLCTTIFQKYLYNFPHTNASQSKRKITLSIFVINLTIKKKIKTYHLSSSGISDKQCLSFSDEIPFSTGTATNNGLENANIIYSKRMTD